MSQSMGLGFNDAQVATMTRFAWNIGGHIGLTTALVVKILNSGGKPRNYSPDRVDLNHVG
jgi:hypothetical protein